MMPIWVFLRHVPVSASEFQVPRAACCYSTPYGHNLLSLVHALVAPFPDVSVDRRVANGSMAQSLAISGAAAKVKSP